MKAASALLVLLIVPAVHGKVCDITAFGAKPDGQTLNTDAFTQAIAACAAGGTVLVPGNGAYLTAPMNLTSNQRLEIQEGATILGPTDPKLFPKMAPFPSMGGVITRDGYKCRYGPLVGAFNATNITITGKGTIDGAGAWWWDNRHKLGVESPRLVELQHVTGLTISGITLTNSPFWTLHPIYCRDIHIHDIRITADGKGKYSSNTDGIDPDSCQNVLIEDYYYCAGDDAVAIKSGWNWAGIQYGMPSTNITVRRAFSGCRGGFTIGSEMSGGVSNISFLDSVSTGESGIRISSELGRGGYVRDVLFKNLSFSWNKIEGKTFLFHVAQDYKPDNPNKTLSFFDNIRFENITVTSAPNGLPIGDITCLHQTPCHNISLEAIHLAPGKVSSPKALSCKNVHGSQTDVDSAIPASCTNNSGPPSPQAASPLY
jgi:polygalacturonase